jgi:hypothetical protein
VTTHLALSIDVAAPAQNAWDAMTDWPAQGEWMLGTKVEVSSGDGSSVGSTLAAFTGAGPLGFLDTMTITAWEPPARCDVVHTGRVVRGTGTMIVEAAGESACRVTWIEDLDLPFGVVGKIGFPFVRPFFLAGVRKSLQKFAALVESGSLPAARMD